jgi:putative membrane protein
LHSLVGTALGLLLVFRTNASYDRYWEGRRLWGAIVNDSRSLIRAGRIHLAADSALLAELTRWTATFAWASMSSLRGKDALGASGADLPPTDAAAALDAQHTPLYITLRMSQCIAAAKARGLITDIIQTSLEQRIAQLTDALGGCERIRKTPLPFAYVVHLRRALVIYCFTLPFALVETFGWMTVLDVVLVAYTYFGIEEIGVEIEGPFGYDENDLPLEQICTTIHDNVYALAELEKYPRETITGAL